MSILHITNLGAIPRWKVLLSMFLPSRPIWQVSDETIVRLETNSEHYESAVVTGLKAGTATVDYAGVKCEITVQSKEEKQS